MEKAGVYVGILGSVVLPGSILSTTEIRRDERNPFGMEWLPCKCILVIWGRYLRKPFFFPDTDPEMTWVHTLVWTHLPRFICWNFNPQWNSADRPGFTEGIKSGGFCFHQWIGVAFLGVGYFTRCPLAPIHALCHECDSFCNKMMQKKVLTKFCHCLFICLFIRLFVWDKISHSPSWNQYCQVT